MTFNGRMNPARRDVVAPPHARQAAIVGAAAIALLLAACNAGGPVQATPAPRETILDELGRRGGEITQPVSGDTGCNDQSLVANAVHFRLASREDRTPRDVYLFEFRNRAAYERAVPALDACRAVLARAGTGPIQEVAVPPYRALGTGWTDSTGRLLRESMTVAAGGS